MSFLMKKYAVYNLTLNKYAPKGEINSIKNAGYSGHRKSAKELDDGFWSKKPSHYSRLQDASRQLRYCIREFGNKYVLCVIEYNLQESERYILVDDELVPATSTAKLLYR